MARWALAAAGAAAAAAAAAGSWVVVWEDDFTGDAVNTSSWNVYDDVYEGVNQIELYTPDNVWVADGNLVIRTHPANVTIGSRTYNVTSGRVDTAGKINVTYGRVEVRAALQSPAAIGIHTAHWLLGYETAERPCWPQIGEIDIMEMEVEDAGWVRSTSNYHYGTACGKDDNHAGSGVFPPGVPKGQNPVNFTAEFHTFGVTWNASAIVLDVDGSVFNSYTSGEPKWPNITIPDWPMYLIISQAYMVWRRANVPDWAWPVFQLVDSVRVLEWVP
jgi:beta-glucanase (GH16 family)